MSCFCCLSRKTQDIKVDIDNGTRSTSHHSSVSSENGRVNYKENGAKRAGGARSFTFRELATATKNFRDVNLIGEGGFGKIVAVKQLDHEGVQGHQEFIVEVLMLSLLHHANLVTLIGYCTAGDQRLLVYEYMPMGSLEDHLYGNFFFLKSRPLLKDQKKYSHLADPRLQGRFPRRCLNYAIAITAMCLNEEATYRPMITDIVVALDYLASQSENNPVSRNAGANSAPSSTTEFSRDGSPCQNSEGDP
ncbi:hypothetical protein Pint_09223 [Pistacia integerrima]|uniref:Uncharacterized protein n=1 Tax=Pistacia integerrima TaxID=434235 RepID=A0ACC0XUX0_9ROSI|nr:hypothetical protein Pint_09223 [Pistacia integerrima]